MITITAPEERCPYPVGSKLTYWHWFQPTQARVTAQRGLVEVISETSVHPETSLFAKAPIGETVIRLYQEDGVSLSAKYERFLFQPIAPGEPKRWYLASENPNT
jgi:hypothetical protein